MLIKQLLKKQQRHLAEQAEQGQLLHTVLLARNQHLTQSILAFIDSTPGLMVSFGLGCLFQLRHSSPVKLLRSAVGLRWFTKS
jgi:hypothetical protein